MSDGEGEGEGKGKGKEIEEGFLLRGGLGLRVEDSVGEGMEQLMQGFPQ